MPLLKKDFQTQKKMLFWKIMYKTLCAYFVVTLYPIAKINAITKINSPLIFKFQLDMYSIICFDAYV